MQDRLGCLRELMDERGWEAVALRGVADLRWVLGCARVFDDEVAHTAFVTQDGAWLHTDSRYHGALDAAIENRGAWELDMQAISHASWLAERVSSARVRVLAVEDTVTLGFFEELEWECNRRSVGVVFCRMHDDVCRLRIVKDASEVELMRRAQAVTDAAFDHIRHVIEVGMTELEIRAELESYMLSHGGDALSFDTIVAAGENGANPHARPSERRVALGDMIVMDYGAALYDYHSDMTRTVCVGDPTPEQVDVFDVVRRAHEECAELATPGVTGRALHEHAVRVIEEAGYGGYFNHGLGHGVGLEIHELPYVGMRGDDPIPVGAVFTIEPGIYLPGRFGVRLEDFGVMGEGGYEAFTRSTHELVTVG